MGVSRLSLFQLRVDAGSEQFIPERHGDSEVAGGIAVMMLEMVDSHVFEPSYACLGRKVAAVVHPFV